MTPAHAANRSSASIRTNVAPAAAEAVDDRGQRVERARRPGVEEDDGAVARRGRPGEGVGGHRRAGPRRLPVLEHDVGSPRRDSRAPASAASDPRVVVARRRTGTGTTAAGPRRSTSRIAASAVAHVASPMPVVGQERHPGVVEAVVADQVAVVGDRGARGRARPPPSGPGGSTSRDAARREHVEEAGASPRVGAAGRGARRRT